MRKVIQIFNELGEPVAGHVFEAPDEATLATSMEILPAGQWVEVASEEDLVIVPLPSSGPVESAP